MRWAKKKADGTIDRRLIKANRTKVDGRWFDSAREAARYVDLKAMEAAGEIRDLELQPKFPLVIKGRNVLIRSRGYPNGRKATYKADFAYTVVATGEEVVEDSKGYDTPIARLRRAVVEAIYGIRIKLT